MLFLRQVIVCIGLFSITAAAQDEVVVAEQTVAETLALQGEIEAVNHSTVSAQTAGRIVELPVDIDDAVAAGDIIVRLDDTEQRARLHRAEAALASAKATFTDAKRRFERLSALYQQGSVSAAERDDAETLVDTSRARVAEAQAAVDEAAKQLSYTQIRAPYAGIVTARFVELGESVQPGQPLMSGLSLEQLRVVSALPQRYAQYVREHRQANIATDDGRQLPIASMTFYPYADEQSHTFRLRFNLNNPDGGLFPGVLVTVNVVVGERDVLLIPESALVVRGELRAVYVLNKNDTPQLRQVRVGHHFDRGVEVLAGLVAGERILASVEAMPNE